MSDERPNATPPQSLLRRLGPAGPMALGAAVLPPLGSIALFASMNQIGLWLREHGLAGVALYVLGFSVLAGFALLPTYASAILGGWAFGFGFGFPAALAGFLGGSAIGYALGRAGSGERVVRVINEKPKWRAVRDALIGDGQDGRPGHGFWKTLGIVSLVRLPPNSPFALTNLVMASVKVRLAPYLIGTLIGMAPRTGAVVVAASYVRTLSAADAAKGRPWWLIPAGIVLTLVVLGIIGSIGNRAIARVTGKGAKGM